MNISHEVTADETVAITGADTLREALPDGIRRRSELKGSSSGVASGDTAGLRWLYAARQGASRLNRRFSPEDGAFRGCAVCGSRISEGDTMCGPVVPMPAVRRVVFAETDRGQGAKK
jgi:hypothetical protein